LLGFILELSFFQMADEQWEVVNTKTKKKAKDAVRKEKKSNEEKEKQKLLLLEERKKSEIKEQFFAQYVQAKGTQIAPNSFDALVDMEAREKKKEAKKKKQLKEFDGETVEFIRFPEEKKKKQSKSGSKPKPNKSKGPVSSLKEVSTQIDSKVLKELINQISNKYPNNYEIQLKSVAEYLENIYNNTSDEDLEGKTDIPLAYVPKDAQSTIKTLIDRTPDDALAVFFWFFGNNSGHHYNRQ